MINNTEFGKRLNIIMKYFQLSASAFADRIQVQRSSISHLLSGRNKPSLDFVMKVVKEFDEVELYWLLNGKGEFPKNSTTPSDIYESQQKKDLKYENDAISKNKPYSLDKDKKSIERIVIFYTDGTFSEYLK
jgi:transcriptional regulator with XRE-family HTH domain